MKVIFLAGARNHLPMFFVLADWLKREEGDVEIQFSLFNGYRDDEKIKEKGYQVEEINENEIGPYPSERWNSALFAKNYVDGKNADVIFMPYEFGFLHFVSFFSKEKRITTVHVQHALWGKGKFFEEFFSNDTSKIDQGKPERSTSLSRIVRKVKMLFRGDNKFPKEISRALKTYYSLNNHEKKYPLSTDYFLAPNEAYKAQVIQERPTYPKKKIVVSGVLKEGLDVPLYTRQQLADEFNLDLKKDWICYLFAAFENYPERYHLNKPSREGVLDLIKALNTLGVLEQYQILVLEHPTAPEDLSDIANEYSSIKLIQATNEHFDIYRQSKLICGVKSTALMEACTSLNPVIRQDYVLRGEYDAIQRSSKAIYLAKDVLQLGEILREVVVGGRHKKRDFQLSVAEQIYTPLNEIGVKTIIKR